MKEGRIPPSVVVTLDHQVLFTARYRKLCSLWPLTPTSSGCCEATWNKTHKAVETVLLDWVHINNVHCEVGWWTAWILSAALIPLRTVRWYSQGSWDSNVGVRDIRDVIFTWHQLLSGNNTTLNIYGACVYIPLCVYVCVHMLIYVYICVQMCAYVPVCVYMHVCVCLYVCAHVYLYLCVNVFLRFRKGFI